MDFLHFLVVTVVIYIIYKFARRNNAKPVLINHTGTGEYRFDIVGEQSYQAAIAKLAGDHGTENAQARHMAQVSLDDKNPYDSEAVAVTINGHLVGYFSRPQARAYREYLRKKRTPKAVMNCPAMIMGGGTKRDGVKLHYGVRLDFSL